MRILVINASPKGKDSITFQTVRYLAKLHPEHQFKALHVGKKIRAFERDITPALRLMEAADFVLFAYPVYTFIAPWQLHRFVELVKESGVDLAGKFVSQITTSKHFYDVTAHRWLTENAQDMGMRVLRGLSADMDDLLTTSGQRQAREHFDFLMNAMENGIVEPRLTKSTPAKHCPVTVPDAPSVEKPGDVVILTNCTESDEQLRAMIRRFAAVLPRASRVINIGEYPFSGGCLGCFHCAVDGKCIYKDGFDEFLRTEIQRAEAIVMAFSVKDHSMGASFKLYDDRQFCNGHRTVTMGMPMGYLISGNYADEPNLQMILEGRANVGGNYLAGIATDEENPDAAIDALAKNLDWALATGHVPPQNFLGVGGMKIFRDLIWIMQGMMKADHRFYKAHGQYDFPQKQWPRMLAMYAVGAMLASPELKKKLGSKMTEGMLMPYNAMLKKLK
ncbi:MAG: iron-sulfur protein [Ruminococcaceae bacterium]|nr:iron-sulfur protein [Oscillospiraceae bacterium]